MPWETHSVEDNRYNAVLEYLSGLDTANDIASKYGISRKTLYKFIVRFTEEGKRGLRNRSTKPQRSPNKLPDEAIALIVSLRLENPDFGARRIQYELRYAGYKPPSVSSIHRVLVRAGLVAGNQPDKEWQRFERSKPNELWQLDIKGPLNISGYGKVYPIDIIDDHSRFIVGMRIYGQQTQDNVIDVLDTALDRYGYPRAIITDNGSQFTTRCEGCYTYLESYLALLGIKHFRTRVRHPQTIGKLERFHRTLKYELFKQVIFADLEEANYYTNLFVNYYNYRRPHQGIGNVPPVDRYLMAKKVLPIF
jgi:transposase InsO family protein